MRPAVAALLAFHVAVVQAQTSMTRTGASASQSAPTNVDQGDQGAARLWGLSLDDYRRSQALMKGIRGAVSDPRITPIEVLGIHARDDAERRKYAEIFARVMAEDAQRVLQFQHEYQQAFRRLYPTLVAVERRPSDEAPSMGSPGAVGGSNTKLRQLVGLPQATTAGPTSRPPDVMPGDRLLVFTRDDCDTCDAVVRRAVGFLREGVMVDLFLHGASSAKDVQRYASRLAIDPALVRSGRLTLNSDGGALARVLPQRSAPPALVRKRGDSLVELEASQP
jgi:integrating conjugative element protein (TIGR03759 family)